MLGAPELVAANEFGHSILGESDRLEPAIFPATSSPTPLQTASVRRKSDELSAWFNESPAERQVEPWPYHGLTGERRPSRGDVEELPDYPHAPESPAAEPTALYTQGPDEPLPLFAPGPIPREAPRPDLPVITPGPTARR